MTLDSAGTEPRLPAFHPAVQAWFREQFAHPTEVQQAAWSAIATGDPSLISAPTGSGKTLAAFLWAINQLMDEGLRAPLPDVTRVLYISPLKALSNDIGKNLQQPIMGIRDQLLMHGLPDVDLQAAVRTGDTPAAERARMLRRPPHILVTTPESVFLLLTARRGRELLRTVRTVIVDEVHAVAGNKRGSHLALSLARLEALVDGPLQRIGLSATQKPIEAIARFLTGIPAAGARPCRIIDTGHRRTMDTALLVPPSPLDAVMSHEVWSEVYDRLAELASSHRTTLIFVNTRRLAERAAKALAERLGEAYVDTHHGSLSRRHRLRAEQRLKQGELRALVATASLELGIDIGEVDLVCQIGSPKAISTWLQRVGRSGHAVERTPRGRLIPTTRDELVECTALLAAVRAGELDRIRIPEAPLDVLAQQIVAEVGSREWEEQALYDCVRAAAPYATLSHARFQQVLQMLAEGYTTQRGRRGAYLYWDRINGKLRGRRGAALTALTNGGAIPDQFDVDVILQPEGHSIGTVHEDFAFESLPGDIFQLGNSSYRIAKSEVGRLFVEDAHGAPPSIPFWFGEAPGRSDELSAAVSALRGDVAEALGAGGVDAARALVHERYALAEDAASQLVDYLATAEAALGTLPTQQQIVFERFFDEVGDMHLVIHAPFGSRINRAWGLALRKRFCRKFNFELQAAALEDSLVLSLGSTHSFALPEVAAYLHPATARDVLIQALLDTPMFANRWRWNASISLAVKRRLGGKRRPPQFQRSDAEDLVALVFPDQIACQENLAGPRTIPDHPLVVQTLEDCLHEAMDVDGFLALLQRLHAGEIALHACDLPAPSPLAHEVVNARPWAFLDDGEAEQRRTRAVATPALALGDAARLRTLDPVAIARVREEAWPTAQTPDELHDALLIGGWLTEAESHSDPAWPNLLTALQGDGRAQCLQTPSGALHIATERQPLLQTVMAAQRSVADDDATAALAQLLQARLDILGPITAEALVAPLGLSAAAAAPALNSLEASGAIVRGTFDGDAPQWCERRLLARIHRDALRQRRARVTAVPPQSFLRFLLTWQCLEAPRAGAGAGAEALALARVLERLAGFPLPAGALEREILAPRLADYAGEQLDQLLTSGQYTWLRAGTRRAAGSANTGPIRQTPILLVPRRQLAAWRRLAAEPAGGADTLSADADRLWQTLQETGPAFFSDLLELGDLLESRAQTALGELVAAGRVSCDTFIGLRALLAPPSRGRRRPRPRASLDAAGRWVPIHPLSGEPTEAQREQAVELAADALLQRYGVVFRRLLDREPLAPTWRELHYVLRRREARGELEGGRFVQGFAGEQFALPAAAEALRGLQAEVDSVQSVVVNAADPVNLTGIVLPAPRVPAVASNRILLETGRVVACKLGRRIEHAQADAAPAERWRHRTRLLRGPGTAPAEPSSSRQDQGPGVTAEAKKDRPQGPAQSASSIARRDRNEAQGAGADGTTVIVGASSPSQS